MFTRETTDGLPPIRKRSVVRSALLERLLASRSPVVAILAPPGYGKTTLLRQWAERIETVAYLPLDERDNDPTTLLLDIAAALDRIAPLPPGMRGSLAAPEVPTAFQRAGRLLNAAADLPDPTTLMLDDVHLLTARDASDILGWFLLRVPATLRMVIAGRQAPELPLARLRVAGRLLELDTEDLTLDTAEVVRLASLEGHVMAASRAAEVRRRTEGWPAAAWVLLRALAEDGRTTDPRDGTLIAATRFDEYLRAELLDPEDPETRSWLLRSSVLESMTGPLCDAVLGATASLGRLRDMERRNRMVHAMDPGRHTFRYHHLYREMLRQELAARDPEEAAAVARRAAAWCEGQGQIPDAVRYARRSGDLDLLAGVVGRHALPLYWRGGLATLTEWLGWFDEDGLRDRYASLAVLSVWVNVLQGRLPEATRWLLAAERAPEPERMPDGSSSKQGWIATVRAFMMPAGSRCFEADVEDALRAVSASGPMAQAVRVVSSVRGLLAGDLVAADAEARIGVELAEAHGAAPGLLLLVGIRAAIAIDAGDIAAARGLIDRCLASAASQDLGEVIAMMLVHAVAARVSAAEGGLAAARRHLGAFNRFRSLNGVTWPWLAVLSHLHAIRACLAVGEGPAARALVGEARDVLRHRPELGVLVTQLEDLRPRVEVSRASGAGPWVLTGAELRLLSYLPTHLTFREIAERFHVSPHTVKTQAMSIYGKLEVSSRREALERAVEAGLLDPSILRVNPGAPTGT